MTTNFPFYVDFILSSITDKTCVGLVYVSKAAGVLSIRNRNYFFHCQHLGSPTVFFVLLISYFYLKKFFALYLDPNDACVLSSFFTLIPMMPVFCFRSLP